MVKHPEATPSSLATLRRWLQKVGPAEAFQVLASLFPDAAIFAVDEKRDIVFWSDGAEHLLGFTRLEVLGRHCLTGIRCSRCLQGCGIAEHRLVKDIPLSLHRADGSEVQVRKHGFAFFDARDAFAGGIELLLPDLTAHLLPPPPRERTVEFHGIVTRDPSMLKAIQIVRNVAETEATVLVRGESGSGKELVARAIHLESHRRDGPFVAVNCGALTPSLLESELFGHVKGAFTGAVADRQGIFVQAHKGTLFLDEVAEMPLELQPRLLRVLQEREVVPVGGTKPVPVDVRLVAATHRGLREEVRAGRFREDLMYRLRVVPLFLPPLRERPADVELLLEHFLELNNRRGPRHVREIAPQAMRALLDHTWPGNVRELQNVVEYAFAVGRGPSILLEELPPEFREHRTVAQTSKLEEEAAMRDALLKTGGNINQAAERLQMSRTRFWRLRKKYGI